MEIALYRDSHALLFELRIIYLILLSNLLLNTSFHDFFYKENFRASRIILLFYLLAISLVQARSLLFEIFIIFFYVFSIKDSERIKIKYILGIILAMIIPNLFVIIRNLDVFNPQVFIQGLFAFEYSIMLNNFLGAALEYKESISDRISLLPSLNLLIPSFVRNYFNISAIKSEHYQIISANAEELGGGFSLLGDLYLYFGWFSPLLLGLVVGIISYLNSFIRSAGSVKIKFSVVPLIYACLLLSLRNDFGVFLKYFFQALLVATILDFIINNFRIRNS